MHLKKLSKISTVSLVYAKVNSPQVRFKVYTTNYYYYNPEKNLLDKFWDFF